MMRYYCCIWPKGGQFLHRLTNYQRLKKESVSLNLKCDSVMFGSVFELVAGVGLNLEDAPSKIATIVGT
jgi:hypothetical protein